MKSLVILISFLTVSVSASAQVTHQCKVPVCDIAAQVRTLKMSSQNDRYQFVSQLLKTYHNSNSAFALQNLRAFGTAAVILFKEVHEEDWVIRAAQSLHDEAVFGIARFERPVLAKKLVEYYLELSDQDTRFSILNYWTTQISTIDDIAVLTELMNFAIEAKKISRAAKEDDYVLRQCDQILEKGSIRATQISPSHEGLYSVEMKCNRDARVKSPCSALVMMVDRLVVMDTQSTNGLVVTLSESRSETKVFEYALTSFSNAQLQGMSRIDQRPSQFSATIDRTTGTIAGTLATTQTLGINYEFIARPIRTAGEFKTGSSAKNEQITGLYRGTLGEQTGQFIVRKFDDGTFAASWLNDASMGSFQIDFQTEVTVAAKGLITFVAHPSGKSEFKLFLQKTTDPIVNQWTGFYLMPSGRINEVNLVKVTDDAATRVKDFPNLGQF
jgi:hypothetical protein